jgi:steroid delta-isomerase
MDENNPALVAARASWRAVQAKDREAWLGLMADDICMEDPIGLAPTNPTGEGVRGKQAISEFWDEFIGPSQIGIETHESFAAGLESAHVMTLNTRLATGHVTRVHGIFTYRVNDDGKLVSLRGYWSLDDMKVEQPA